MKKLFNRCICMFKGHEPKSKPTTRERLTEKQLQLSNKTMNSPAGMTYFGNGLSAGPYNISAASLFTISMSPIEQVELHICKRCHSIFTKTEKKQHVIDKVKNYPALIDAMELNEQMEWEAKMQNKHPTVDAAWKQYQLALKLCVSDEKNNDD